jgi:hypothetical protein
VVGEDLQQGFRVAHYHPHGNRHPAGEGEFPGLLARRSSFRVALLVIDGSLRVDAVNNYRNEAVILSYMLLCPGPHAGINACCPLSHIQIDRRRIVFWILAIGLQFTAGGRYRAAIRFLPSNHLAKKVITGGCSRIRFVLTQVENSSTLE